MQNPILKPVTYPCRRHSTKRASQDELWLALFILAGLSIDAVVKSQKAPIFIIPTEVGIQVFHCVLDADHSPRIPEQVRDRL
ncbi:MAG: hypothetical protein DRG82_11920 [Deltaproteobacteria bacterium]|nr:MAG: hypothetical protein DRG82_11920 [Deltaproteobacteria bacterium]